MKNIQITEVERPLNLKDIRDASANIVAACFWVWLGMENGGDIKTPSMRESYVRSLTARNICCDLLASVHDEKYNLYNCGGSEAADAALSALEQTKGFEASKRVNGGNGVCQAAFNKYRLFWKFLEDGGTIPSEGVCAVIPFMRALQQETAPNPPPLSEPVNKVTLVEQIVELLNANHFIVLETLSKLIEPEIFAGVKNPKGTRVTKNFMDEVKNALDGLCAIPNARIGKIDPQDARYFGLSEDVYYSTEWMIQQMKANETLAIAGLIGLAIYEEFQDLSVELYKETGDPESTLKYRGATAWITKRNHQKIVVFEEFFRFLGIFMPIKAPYAFRLAEELEKDQTMPEKKRRAIVTKMYEYLATCFAYEPALQKLKMLK